MTSASDLFTKLGVGAQEIVQVEERVSDDELLKDTPYFMVLGAFRRAPAAPGATITKPFEAWDGYGEVRDGRWILRSLSNRAHLGRLLMAQCQYHGLAFYDVTKRIDEPGAVSLTPGAAGVFGLVDRKTGVPCILAAAIKIDRTKGRLAGKGQAFFYHVNASARPLEVAVAKIPELPATQGGVLALTAEDENEAAPAEASDAAEPANGDASFSAPKTPARSRRR